MRIDLNTSLKNNIHENSLTKMINKYYITESAIIKRVYSVQANSEEEAKEKFNKGIWFSFARFTDSSQIENVQFIQEVEK